MGNYYYSIFDHLGNRLYGGKITILPEIILEQNLGIVLEGKNKFKSTTTNAKTTSNIIFNESVDNGFINYEIKNTNAKQLIGLIDTSNPDFVKYGFQIENGKVKIIDNNNLNGDEVVIGENAILSIVKESNGLFFKINGKTEKITTLGSGYILKSGFATEVLGVEVINSSLSSARQRTNFFYNNSILGDCQQENATLKFKYTLPNSNNFLASLNYTIVNMLTGTIISSGNLAPNTEFQLNNAPYGIYKVQGTVINTFPTMTISEIIVIGVKGVFYTIKQYDLVPNDYSLKKNTVFNSTNRTYASALSINQLITNENNAWITFLPVLQNNGVCIIGFSNTDDLNLPTNNYIRFARVLNSSNVSYSLVNEIGSTTYSGIIQLNGLMALKISSTTIELISSFQSVTPFLTTPRPAGNFRIKFWSKHQNEGFSNIICSFICRTNPPPLTLAQVGYAEMKREIDAGYTYAVEGKVKFSFEEEYSIDLNKKLNYNLLDKNNNPVAGCINGTCYGNAVNLDYNKNDNRYELPISTIQEIQIGDFFTIEVTTIKKDKKYLRVQYRN